jgi:predicted GIY-YIG superfamily endonuclease
MANSARDTYKYHFKVGNVIVHGGITNDLNRREIEHQNSGRYSVHKGQRVYWKDGHISQVGAAVTKESGLNWENENGFGANQ